ncbi:hypothetical protein LOD99_10940 [Oopsacas minuta]|uniref:Uncharacterized protein n=1 Tax=Oopsacas minuta TaxID=111878 RepID=A0AAV7KBU5_9METZ|nr:hypothetical protein LOD99_10940 [Oopsacas minuta]
MYLLNITYLSWKQHRKANEPIPELIRLSIENIKPKAKENHRLLRGFIQKRLSEYILKETVNAYLLKKGEKIVLSDGMLQIVIECYHDKQNHPKLTALIKSIKSHFHI